MLVYQSVLPNSCHPFFDRWHFLRKNIGIYDFGETSTSKDSTTGCSWGYGYNYMVKVYIVMVGLWLSQLGVMVMVGL